MQLIVRDAMRGSGWSGAPEFRTSGGAMTDGGRAKERLASAGSDWDGTHAGAHMRQWAVPALRPSRLEIRQTAVPFILLPEDEPHGGSAAVFSPPSSRSERQPLTERFPPRSVHPQAPVILDDLHNLSGLECAAGRLLHVRICTCVCGVAP